MEWDDGIDEMVTVKTETRRIFCEIFQGDRVAGDGFSIKRKLFDILCHYKRERENGKLLRYALIVFRFFSSFFFQFFQRIMLTFSDSNSLSLKSGFFFFTFSAEISADPTLKVDFSVLFN